MNEKNSRDIRKNTYSSTGSKEIYFYFYFSGLLLSIVQYLANNVCTVSK